MKTTLVAVLLFAVGGLAAAQESLSGPLRDIKIPPFVIHTRPAAAGAGQVAPLDVKVQNPMVGIGQIFVGCGFDGHSDTCLLDTGAAVCLVSDDDFFHKYPSLGQSCTAGASGAKVCSDVIGVKDLQVGGIDFGKEAAQRRVPGQSCSGGASMPSYLVGSVWHSLLGHQVAFDFDAKTLTVDGSAAAAGQPMRMVANDTFMLVPASLGGAAPVPLLVDTGAGLTVLDQAYVDANPGGFTFLANTQIQDSSCQKIPVKVYQVNSLGVGGQSLSGTLAVAMDLGPVKSALGGDVQGILGFNAISRFDWSVDLKNDSFSVTPTQSALSIASVEKRSIPRTLEFRLPSLLRGN